MQLGMPFGTAGAPHQQAPSGTHVLLARAGLLVAYTRDNHATARTITITSHAVTIDPAAFK